jgi:RHS repeat-associated protein
LDSSKHLWERIDYDAYGNARHRHAGDVTGNGAYNLLDVFALTGESDIDDSAYHADFDVNFDGLVRLSTGTTDVGIITHADRDGEMTAALPWGWISDPTSTVGPDNSIGYAGYVFNPEREDYSVRFRVYTPELGRWRQRDPAGYIDGILQLYGRASPVMFIDPFGLEAEKEKCDKNKDEDDFHAKRGAYYDITLNCGGKTKKIKGYGRMNSLVAKLRIAKSQGCCVSSMNLSTHHTQTDGFYSDKKKDKVSDQQFANSFRSCKGAKITLNACNTRDAACAILNAANNDGNYNITITWTDGINFHYPFPYGPSFMLPDFSEDYDPGTITSNTEDGDPRRP